MIRLRALVIAVGAVALVLFGVGAPAANALSLDPTPVHLGPVTVDPHVNIDPQTGIDAGVTTQLPDGSSPAVSVKVGPDGTQVSAPAGVAVMLKPPTGTSESNQSTVASNPSSPQSATPVGTTNTDVSATPATSATSATSDGPTLQHGVASSSHAATATAATATASHPRSSSRGASVASSPHATAAATPNTTVNGSIIEPRESQWSTLTHSAQRVAFFLALLALAFVLRVIVSAWARDVRRRRALSPS